MGCVETKARFLPPVEMTSGARFLTCVRNDNSGAGFACQCKTMVGGAQPTIFQQIRGRRSSKFTDGSATPLELVPLAFGHGRKTFFLEDDIQVGEADRCQVRVNLAQAFRPVHRDQVSPASNTDEG